MNEWKDDKRWSDRFLVQIKRILGEHLLREPPVEEDAERNTDLIVLRMDAIRIACRIRRHAYLAEYPNDITIRSGRPSGAKTELTKIVEGWGDFLFYGFSDVAEANIERWRLCDLKAFRLHFNRCLSAGTSPWRNKLNADRSSGFMAIEADSVPGFVFAQG